MVNIEMTLKVNQLPRKIEDCQQYKWHKNKNVEIAQQKKQFKKVKDKKFHEANNKAKKFRQIKIQAHYKMIWVPNTIQGIIESTIMYENNNKFENS